jgi:energy-coupling factor transporter transmembrane protein EcfT
MNRRSTQVKFIFLTLVSSCTIFVRDPYILLGIAITCIAVALWKKKGIRSIHRLTPFLFVAALVIPAQLIFSPDIPLMNRIIEGSIVMLRLISLSLVVFLFIETTSMSQIINALPFFPKQILLMLTISFSLIPVIVAETAKIRMVQATRGLRTSGFSFFRSIIPVLVPLLSRTLSRAEHIAMVIESRGFEG